MITAFFAGLLVGITIVVALYYIKEEWVGFIPQLPLIPFMLIHIWLDFRFDRFRNWIIQLKKGSIIICWNPMVFLRPKGASQDMWVWLPGILKEKTGEPLKWRHFLGFWVYIGNKYEGK